MGWVGGWEGDRQVKGESKNKNKVGSKTKRDNPKNNQIKEGVFWLHAIILTIYKEMVFWKFFFEIISLPLQQYWDSESSQRFDLFFI